MNTVDRFSYARSSAKRIGLARGIRIVPDQPDSSFPIVAFACDIRPGRCGECRLNKCRATYFDPRGSVA